MKKKIIDRKFPSDNTIIKQINTFINIHRIIQLEICRVTNKPQRTLALAHMSKNILYKLS